MERSVGPTPSHASLLAALVDTIPDPIYAKDLDGRFLFCNPAALASAGLSRDDVLGRDDEAYFRDAEVAARVRANDLQVIATGQPATFEERVGSRLFLSTKAPLRDASGRVVGVVGVSRDIRALAEAAESARRRAEELERLLNVLPAFVWMSDDPACNTIIGNEPANRLIAVPPGTNVSQTPADGHAHAVRQFRPDGREYAPDELPLQRAAASGEPVLGAEIRMDLPSGRQLWISGNATPLFEADGRTVRGALGAFVDVTSRHAAEETLRDNEERLRLAQVAAGFGVWEWVPDTGTTRTTPEYDRLYGVAAGTFRSYEDWRARVHPDDIDRIEHERARAFADHAPFEIEYRVLHDDGTWRWMATRGRPIFDGRGQIVRVIGVDLDVSERRRMEQELREKDRLYRAIGESIDWGIWVCDPDGRNIYASESFLQLVGMTQAQCSDYGWGDVLHPDDAERTIAAWKECVRTGGTWDIEHRFRGMDGVWHNVLARGVPVRDEDGRILCWAGINLDIDRLKATEDALRASEESLRAADRRKDEFLATLSHELRNPLGPIRNSLFVLRHAPAESDAVRTAQDVAERQLGQITRLVDDLLDVNRIVRGKIRIDATRVDLGALAARVIDDHRGVFEARGVDLGATLPKRPLWVDGDASRLAQVAGNLLSNAAKFTDRGGSVHVTVAADTERGEARLTVADTGLGIEPALVPQIFEPFSQLDRTLDRSRGGLGLGLTLVARVVALHGGTVSASSDGPGKGAAFTITLPLATSTVRGTAAEPAREATIAPAPGPPSPPEAPRRVLLVDDNADAVDSLRTLLELRGHDVATAGLGFEAVAACAAFSPEVVLCDIGLPDLDGYEVARRIRAMPGQQNILLVALTGYGMEDDRRRALASGFDAHMTKPADLDALHVLLAGLSDREA